MKIRLLLKIGVFFALYLLQAALLLSFFDAIGHPLGVWLDGLMGRWLLVTLFVVVAVAINLTTEFRVKLDTPKEIARNQWLQSNPGHAARVQAVVRGSFQLQARCFYVLGAFLAGWFVLQQTGMIEPRQVFTHGWPRLLLLLGSMAPPFFASYVRTKVIFSLRPAPADAGRPPS
jgi:hypothetical protein